MFSNLLAMLWSWNMRWTFTRSSATAKQVVLFIPSYGYRAKLTRASHAQGVKNLLFPLCSRCFVSAWVLDLRKNAGWFTVEKVPFFWSTSYPAKFGAFNWDLELVPSSIGPFLVFFWPSIRRYRIEYLAIYAALATKYFFHTHTHTHTRTLGYQNGLPNDDQNPKNLVLFLFATIRPSGQPPGKIQGFGPGDWG